MKNYRNLELVAKKVRRNVIGMIIDAHASHIASSYSVVELLVYLYEKQIHLNPKNPKDPLRDRFILSKGWGISALYAVLAQKGIISESLLKEYCHDGSKLIGIATRNGIPGIEATTGSMGHGLPLGVGMAKALKLQKNPARVYVVMSDGECDEGSTWEGILLGAHHKLSNLTVIVDYNKWQSFGRTKDVLNLDPLAAKWKAFNWHVQEINGHDFAQIELALKNAAKEKSMPSVIIANTIKGKGLPIIEDKNQWHYQTPRAEEIEAAKKEGLL
jgi:transketolase